MNKAKNAREILAKTALKTLPIIKIQLAFFYNFLARRGIAFGEKSSLKTGLIGHNLALKKQAEKQNGKQLFKIVNFSFFLPNGARAFKFNVPFNGA